MACTDHTLKQNNVRGSQKQKNVLKKLVNFSESSDEEEEYVHQNKRHFNCKNKLSLGPHDSASSDLQKSTAVPVFKEKADTAESGICCHGVSDGDSSIKSFKENTDKISAWTTNKHHTTSSTRVVLPGKENNEGAAKKRDVKKTAVNRKGSRQSKYNKTLADFSVHLNFSESSDEEVSKTKLDEKLSVRVIREVKHSLPSPKAHKEERESSVIDCTVKKKTPTDVCAEGDKVQLNGPFPTSRSSNHCNVNSTDFLAGAALHEDSLLPILESTRFDCPDLSVAKQWLSGTSVGKRKSSNAYSTSSFPARQNSSYGEINTNQKGGSVEEVTLKEKGRCACNHHRGSKTNVESQSQYGAALQTVDLLEQSLDSEYDYEVVDVSMQTSFKALTELICCTGGGEKNESVQEEISKTHKANIDLEQIVNSIEMFPEFSNINTKDTTENRNSLDLQQVQKSCTKDWKDISQQEINKNMHDSNYFSESNSCDERILVPESPDIFGSNLHESGTDGRRYVPESPDNLCRNLNDSQRENLDMPTDSSSTIVDINKNSEFQEEILDSTRTKVPESPDIFGSNLDESGADGRRYVPESPDNFCSNLNDSQRENLDMPTDSSSTIVVDFNKNSRIQEEILDSTHNKVCLQGSDNKSLHSDDAQDNNVKDWTRSGSDGRRKGEALETETEENEQSHAFIEEQADSGEDARQSKVACVPIWRARLDDSSSEDDDDKLEAFFQKVRLPETPAKKPITKQELQVFIVSDSDVTDSEEASGSDTLPDLDDEKDVASDEDIKDESSAVESSDEDMRKKDNGDSLRTPLSRHRQTLSSCQTSPDVSMKWCTPATSAKVRPKPPRGGAFATPLAGNEADGSKLWTQHRGDGPSGKSRAYSFLQSLSLQVPDHCMDPEAKEFVNHFKKKRADLSSRLFAIFNFTIFENQLPGDLPIVWNKRLLKTAGLCKQKRVGERYAATIELSVKVCDSAERVRDTLVHELCHAAVWLINKTKEGHGHYWKLWARKANKAHPDIPVIKTCHDYTITTKFIYQCLKCGYKIGRHSKSLDTEKMVCGKCHGRFQLLLNSRAGHSSQATPRTPNRFALFVKENYGSVKKQGLPHRDVMDILSKEFAKAKITFTDK